MTRESGYDDRYENKAVAMNEENPRDLAQLPEIPLSPALRDTALRRARIAFLEQQGPENANAGAVHLDGMHFSKGGQLAVVWTHTVLPALLLLAGAVYTWSTIAMMARVYLP